MNEHLTTTSEAIGAHMGWELTVHIQGPRQSADHVLRRVAAEGIEILAHTCSGYYGGTKLLIVTVDVDASCATIRDAGYKCDAKPVIWVAAPCRVGLGAVLGEKLRAKGIEILYSYGSWDAWPRAVLVFKTSRDDVAFRVLNATLEKLSVVPPSPDGFVSAA